TRGMILARHHKLFMQFSGGEIKRSYQNNDKQKYNANPQHNKYGFTHGSAKKKRGVGSCPYIIKITTRIICMNLISYAEDAGQASKMNWCYEKKR
ncbi:hypothetical protein ACV2I9_24730, partial [Salmonella enterica subsp. enterica serovar Sandiego]